jgi:hypothetical protein
METPTKFYFSLWALWLVLVAPVTGFQASPFVGQRNVRSTNTLHISLDDSWDEISSTMSKVSPSLQVERILKSLSAIQWENWDSRVATLSSVLSDLAQVYVTLPLWAEVGVVVVPLQMLLIAALYSSSFPNEDYREAMEPYVRGNYNQVQARAYYARHRGLVVVRLAQILRLSNKFLIGILFDKYILRDEEKNRGQRATELLTLITQLGPTAIKIGQALSVRQDLIPEEYATALSTLQDQVPPFDGEKAKEALLRELGAEKMSHLKDIGLNDNRGPVASASIGQVYRGFIDDKEVAVKVQRPNVLAEIGKSQV